VLTATVQNRSKAGLCQCRYTCGDLFFIQVCSDPTPVHNNIVLDKMHTHLRTAAVQNMSTAVLCRCNYTCGDLIFIHVCSDPTPAHSDAVLCKMHVPVLTAAVQNRSTAGLCQCNTPVWIWFLCRCVVPQHPTPVHSETVLCKMHTHIYPQAAVMWWDHVVSPGFRRASPRFAGRLAYRPWQNICLVDWHMQVVQVRTSC